LEKMPDMILWLKDIVIHYGRIRRSVRRLKKKNGRKSLMIVVHGDTVTTVLGSLFGRLNRLPVAHIEAGLRSGNWRHPFPEELDRRVVSKIATLHYAPGKEPFDNLRKAGVKGGIVNTKYNTVLDSLRLARSENKPIKGLEKLPDDYFVVSIHRNELMARPDELARTLENIAAKAEDFACIFLDHPVTKERIYSLKLDRILEKKNITRLHKLRYFQFISLMSRSSFIVTDSGGLQEEAAYLGIPCLVHRLATERNEGLGQNAVLSLYDDKKVKEFLSNPDKYRTKGLASDFSPTRVIYDSLKSKGYVK
jgi:UDP-N-acetylglucosamine 2-epimerase (non-hydrolysing)